MQDFPAPEVVYDVMHDDVVGLRAVACLAWRVVHRAEDDRVAPEAGSGRTWTLAGTGYPAELYALAAALDDLSERGIVHLSPLIRSDDRREAPDGRPWDSTRAVPTRRGVVRGFHEARSGPTPMVARRSRARIGFRKGVWKMSTMSHEPSQGVHDRPRWLSLRLVPEMWASLAITAMWVAVFITAIWGPDARFSSNDGNSSTIPTAVFVTVFAFLGTWVVARYGFRQQRKE